MSETPPQVPTEKVQPQKKELYKLPPERRRLEAVRKVHEMRIVNVGNRGEEPWPIELRGYQHF